MIMNKIDSKVIEDFEKNISTRKSTAKTLKTNPLHNRLIENYNDILLAVKEVYSKALIVRTIKNHGLINKIQLERIKEKVAKIIYNYFNEEPNTLYNIISFDKWHDDICQLFISEYNKISSGITLPISYGKAQKLINMTFKYLTCYADFRKYEGLFIYAHMPIDSNILKQFKKYTSISGITLDKYNGKRWSYLDRCDYLELVEKYRSYFGSRYPDFTMLNIEFYLWDSAINNKVFSVPMSPNSSLKVKEIEKFYY